MVLWLISQRLESSIKMKSNIKAELNIWELQSSKRSPLLLIQDTEQ